MNHFPVFMKTLRDQRVPVLAWSLALVVLGYIYIAIYPQYKDASSALSDNAYFQSLAGDAGGIGTPGGYLNAEFFTSMPLLVLIFAIIAGTGTVAAEESGGTLDLLMAQPIRRGRLLLEKTAALSLLVVLVTLVSLAGLLLGKLTVGFDLSAIRMTEACLNMAPIALLYLALAILGSAAVPGRTWSTVLAIGAATAGFFLNTFGAFVDALAQVRKLSPFYWANYGRVIAHGTDWWRDLAFLALAAAIVGLATLVFVRRDLSSGSRTLRLARAHHGAGSTPPCTDLQAAPAHRRWPITWKTLREQRAAGLAWAAAILVLSFVHVVIYPQFHDAFKAFDESGAFQPFAGEAGTISSPAGYLNTEFFSYVPLLILIAVVIAGTGVVAGDEAAGTLDLVLAQPVSRRSALIQKAAGLLVLLGLMVGASVPGLLIAKAIVDFDLDYSRLIASALFMIPLPMLYLSIAIFCSAVLPSRTAAAIVVIGAAIAGYFVNTLGAFVDALEPFRRVSPFYWADYSAVLVHGFDWGRALAFGAISSVFLAGAVVLFERRDLSSGRVAVKRLFRGLARHPGVN